MTGLTSLQLYKKVFNKTQYNNKFKPNKLLDEKRGGVSCEKVRDEIERDLEISDITRADL